MISSASNKQIKEIAQLNKNAKARRELRAFVVEGEKLFRETPRELIRHAYVTEEFLGLSGAAELLEEKGAAYDVVSGPAFMRACDTETPRGILAVVSMPEYGFSDVLRGGRCLLVLEDIQDPGNLGAMFRTGEGAGISGIIMSRGTADVFSPKAVRATMGSVFRVPFFIADDLHGAIRELRRSARVYAAHPRGTCYYDEADLAGRVAFLIGNEGGGLRPETAALADECLKIPMEGRLESLNAAVAAGILMYEAARQERVRLGSLPPASDVQNH